jgi:hypothetical protein
MSTVWKSGRLNFLEPTGPIQGLFYFSFISVLKLCIYVLCPRNLNFVDFSHIFSRPTLLAWKDKQRISVGPGDVGRFRV